MESTQKPEIIFAVKLASNEKPVRSKALLKLRKYISARSGREEGGFGEDELLKIWKGLFYCMWMQDMPLLQEELSTKISRLLHSFQTVDSQLLYFKTFLQTMKREWNGIDRLRMDKFYQLVRFVFREVFEMLKRRNWESSVVSEFLQLFTAQLLQSSSAAPAGLNLHVLELYTTELALVGSTQLTAEQNLTFIEPFCKAMAKTKDRVLLKAISSSVFNTIVDQVPFAIEDLLREIRQGDEEEQDASDESEDQQDSEELKTKSRSKKKTEESAEDCDEDNCSLPDDMDSKDDEDDECRPVLQFDYGAIADRLFEQASHSNIPSFNRSKIYKFVKIFRDLSEGAFPQDEVEDVSTDEDDFDDSRRRKKRKKQTNKGQKEQESLKKSKGQSETAADTSEDTKQKNKKGKKKKRKNRSLKSVEGETEQQTDAQTPVEPSNPSEVRRETQDSEKAKSNAKLSKCDGENIPDEQPNGLGLKLLKKRGRKKTREDASEAAADDSETVIGSTSAEVVTSAPLKKKKKLLKKAKDVGDGEKEHDGQAEVNSVSVLTCSISAGVEEPSAVTPSKRKSTARNEKVKEQQDSQETGSSKALRKTLMKKKKKQKDVVVDVPEPNTNGEAHQEVESVHTEESRQPDGRTEPTTANMRAKKKRKQKSEESADQIKPKKVKVNGHAGKTSVKRPKVISAEEASLPVKTENEIKQKQFVLRQKKAPAPIFCKAAGPNTRKLSKKMLLPSKPETKKVTFGLKNNKTMEISCHSRVSPASQSRVAFDPKRTPKSGVLKSPTSSPAITKRAMAADFF
ncbi:ribosomal RNA processing protein 1 homolog A isoform X2 [Ctenopharyngodon idella]|uniref:ribosomal RNA processing protein 1 homolog A isoform X2 n=1 Tax=Ctenopharyngodon idella TaxID=7959 RepID=UPI002230B0E6|nr:ribosomal RNA processing protein 1 homolog A isoform X2 [Ctenopharyngodon idella]